jgi:ubiquinone/menaquinone biosynthesis C-methylase UbiE
VQGVYQFEAQVLDFYARTAESYDSWAGGVHARAGIRLAELAQVLPGERAVDVGCGTGVTTHLLGGGASEDGCSIGVDVSPHMLEIAMHKRSESGAAQFALMDVRQLVFRDASFDVVILGQILPHIRDPRALLLEAHRLLRSGGRIVVSNQCRSLCTVAQGLFFEKLENVPLRIERGDPHNSKLGEPHVITDLLESTGFDGVETTQLVIGNRTANAHEWINLMTLAGPWPYAVLQNVQPAGIDRMAEQLDDVMRTLGEGAFAYHTAFTFALAQRQ